MPIQKVTDPEKIVTDELVLKRLAEQGIDKNYVEFWHDYAPRSLGKEHSPYAKFYRDLKSNKRFMVASGLPMVKPNGQKIDAGWTKQEDRYVSKANLFSVIVEGKQVNLICLSDQPDGTKKDEQVTWRPQLFVDGSEIVNGEQSALLPVDPINEDYKENTLEWVYGTVCKRRIRIIEGRFRERWVFESNPHSKVRIRHNFAGSLKLRLGRAIDAEGNPLQVTIIDDEEIVEASEFDKAIYPVEIGASATYYPDADPETSSVDGNVGYNTSAGWDAIHDAAGNDSRDTDAIESFCYLSSVNNQYAWLQRGIFVFSTAGLPDYCVITAATFSLYGTSKSDVLYTPKINVYTSNPASNDDLVDADYLHTKFGTTDLSTDIIYATFNIAGYNGFPLIDVDADGFGYISKTSVTKIGTRFPDTDVADLEPGASVEAKVAKFMGYFADQGSNKPKLVVTYTATGPFPLHFRVP